MLLRSGILLFALVAAPRAALPNDIRCNNIAPGQDLRPRALAIETNLQVLPQYTLAIDSSAFGLNRTPINPKDLLAEPHPNLRKMLELRAQGSSFGARPSASMSGGGSGSAFGGMSTSHGMSVTGLTGYAANPTPVNSGVSPEFREHLLRRPLIPKGGEVQLPLSTDTVKNTIELDRIAKTPTMCQLQRGYGVFRPECATLLGTQPAPPLNLATAAPLPGQCAPEMTAGWTKSLDKLSNYTKLNETVTKLLAEYLANPAKFQASRSKNAVAAVTQHIRNTEKLLDNCFEPAETSSYEKQHHVLRQMGKLIRDGEAICTGLMMRDDYFITARHCFENLKSGMTLWFQPHQSQDRYEVCAVAEPEAFSAAKFRDIARDQVLVRIAQSRLRTATVDIAAAGEVLSTTDEAKGNSKAPTLLVNISYFPLAELIQPGRYPSGYVKGAPKYCAAVKMEDGCFAHVCSVISGGSGSPVFVHDANSIKLAGTHVGSSAREGLKCKAALGTSTNSAVMANPLYVPALFKQ